MHVGLWESVCILRALSTMLMFVFSSWFTKHVAFKFTISASITGLGLLHSLSLLQCYPSSSSLFPAHMNMIPVFLAWWSTLLLSQDWVPCLLHAAAPGAVLDVKSLPKRRYSLIAFSQHHKEKGMEKVFLKLVWKDNIAFSPTRDVGIYVHIINHWN